MEGSSFQQDPIAQDDKEDNVSKKPRFLLSKQELDAIFSSSKILRIEIKRFLKARGFESTEEGIDDVWNDESLTNRWFRLIQDKKVPGLEISSTNSEEWIEFEKDEDCNLKLYSEKVKQSKSGCFCKDFLSEWNTLAFFVWVHSERQERGYKQIQIIVDHLLEKVDKFKIFSIDRSKTHANLSKIWSMFQLYLNDLLSTTKSQHYEQILNKIDHHIKSQIRPIHYFWSNGKLSFEFTHVSLWV